MTEPVEPELSRPEAGEQPDVAAPRYIPAERVLAVMADFGTRRLTLLDPARAFVLAVFGGGLITAGALFSVLLATGAETEGMIRLLEGVGFSTGFFFVVLSEAVLFTEANVVLPTTLLRSRQGARRVVRFWVLAWLGNFAGALLLATLVAVAHDYSPAVSDLLRDVVDTKMTWRADGGAGGWFRLMLSGVLANWLVGMAALFAMMARTILGKYIPILLAVSLFVAANFQHSPANMGYFSLLMMETDGPGWWNALAWNIVPAGLGNMLGGALLVALPLSFAFATMGGRRPRVLRDDELP